MCPERTNEPVVILLAEDDEINQQIVRHILATLPFVELEIACDGKAALEAAISRRYDLMIFDRQMPFISGDRVIRHLRAARTINLSTPIIQFTADADHVSIPQGALDHADAIVPKPVQSAQLISTVLKLLRREIGNN